MLNNTDRFGAEATTSGFSNTSGAQPTVEGDIHRVMGTDGNDSDAPTSHRFSTTWPEVTDR